MDRHHRYQEEADTLPMFKLGLMSRFNFDADLPDLALIISWAMPGHTLPRRVD